MNNRERMISILHYEKADRLPIVHFGYWGETLIKWAKEGHITMEEATTWGEGSGSDKAIADKLGFDLDYNVAFFPSTFMDPVFESKIVKEFPDGSKHIMDNGGTILLQRPGAGSIPAEVGHTLQDRSSWEELYAFRFVYDDKRITDSHVMVGYNEHKRFDQGGKEFLQADKRDYWYGIFGGSMLGSLRNVVGVENLAYLCIDDEKLLIEMIDAIGEVSYKTLEYTLKSGAKFDFLHFWEDICFKNGPLINPKFFYEHVGPHYKKKTELAKEYGIDIVSLDCDGMIDSLIPTWLENGVNTMFPIEVGTWNASIAPWRELYGKQILGVGGMNKVVFAQDYKAIDAEIERLKPLIDLGGFIPCPDHRIPPDAIWENVQYYCEKLRDVKI